MRQDHHSRPASQLGWLPLLIAAMAWGGVSAGAEDIRLSVGLGTHRPGAGLPRGAAKSCPPGHMSTGAYIY